MNHLVFFTQADKIDLLVRTMVRNAGVDSAMVRTFRASALIENSGIPVSDTLTVWLKHDNTPESEFTSFVHGIPSDDHLAMVFHSETNAAVRAKIEGQGMVQAAWYAGTLASTFRARKGHHAQMHDGSHREYFALANYLVRYLLGQGADATELSEIWLSFQHGLNP